MPRCLDGIGTLAAVRQVMVSPEVEGRVTAIRFEPGAEVEAGRARWCSSTTRPSGPTSPPTRPRQRLAQRQSRARPARWRSAISRPRPRVDQYQAELDQARAGIAAEPRRSIGQKLIKAPFAGKLGIRQVELGQYVSPGDDARDADRPRRALRQLHPAGADPGPAQRRAARSRSASTPVPAGSSRRRLDHDRAAGRPGDARDPAAGDAGQPRRHRCCPACSPTRGWCCRRRPTS